MNVAIANVLMAKNFEDYPMVRALARELGVECTLDPTVTPMMDGDRSTVDLNVDHAALQQVFRDQDLVGNVDEFCASPAGADADQLHVIPCSAGQTAVHVSPYGDIYPCVQFPLACGNIRQSRFLSIWRHSRQMNDVRSVTLAERSECTHVTACTRCPGPAYMEGDMRGPSIQDCEKSFARTGIPSRNLLAKKLAPTALVQVHGR